MRRRKATVELFEEIRREYEFGVGTIQGVARKFGVHRRLVREALGSAIPGERPSPPRPQPRIGLVAAFIDAILEADRQAPRKQRHTAHRIYVRIGQELPDCPIAESTVRRYVRERKAELGLLKRETFVPQSYDWGVEAQVDWYEAVAELDGERVTVQVFVLRSMASGAAFHRAFHRATQQAFLEAHEYAFRSFGGVFRRLRYDNLPAAIKRVLRGSRREETQRFVAFRSHWRFTAEFCTPAEAHEKGGVENEVGTFRRNHWVPVPQARDLDDLFPTVSRLGCVKVKTNAYSVPVPAGTTVEVRLSAATVAIWHAGRCAATHERCYGRQQEILDLEHYLDVLSHKPGALAGSKPLAQWRKRGRWPASYDRFWQGLIRRHGRQAGTKAMIELLQLGRRYGYEPLRTAIETALDLGCTDSAAVRYLLTSPAPESVQPPVGALGTLAQYERPLPDVGSYDQLLEAGGMRR